MKSPRRFTFLLSALAAVVITAVGGAYSWRIVRSCEVNAVEQAAILLIRQRDRYDHSYQFAASASQSAIVRPVAELQQILMDTQEVAVPGCIRAAKHELINYMGTVIRAFGAFGAQEADSTVRDLIDQSEMHYDNFATEVETARACAPFCFP
jgi:hypothetical protein